MKPWTKQIESLWPQPCQEALDWLETQDAWEAAWQNCKRGDWMLWLLGYLAGPPESKGRKTLALPYAQGPEALEAIEIGEKWARGEVSIKEVRRAASCGCNLPQAENVPAVVLDCAVGSGTTLVAAKKLGRRGIGIDLSARYLALARCRLEEVPLSLEAR